MSRQPHAHQSAPKTPASDAPVSRPALSPSEHPLGSTRKHPSTRHTLTRNGWLPNYHGAWAMIIIPPILGICLSHPRLVHIPLLGTWWIGYFCFFAFLMFIKSRFKKRYVRALLTYALGSLICACAVLLLAPAAFIWAFAFLPCIAIAVCEAWHRRERSALSGFSTVAAASLLLPVASALGNDHYPTDIHAWKNIFSQPIAIWLCTFFIFMYFSGTVLYVKTNIRERGVRHYFIASLTWHSLALIAAVIAAGFYGLWWDIHALAWTALVLRAWIVPARAQKGKPLSVMALGMSEVGTSIALSTLWLACGYAII